MRCTLLIPRLFWPRDAVAVQGLELSSLFRLIARARAQRGPGMSIEAWLCEAFRVPRQRDWPLAPLTLELDGGRTEGGYWLRADPVHLKVDRDRLVLIESALFDLGEAEARALASTLDGYFTEVGLSFRALAPRRWYARLDTAPDLVTRPASEVAGEDVTRLLPEGADALRWHGVYNEIQMLLHDHPVNQEREARGDPPVNSVWLWGGGVRPDTVGHSYDHVWSDEPEALALARASRAKSAPLPVSADALLDSAERQGTHLVVLAELASAAAHTDGAAWRHRLASMESSWFAPLARALREGRLEQLTLVALGPDASWGFDLGRGDLMKFWRSAKPWPQYA